MIGRLCVLCSTLLVLVCAQTTPFIQEVFVGKCYQKNPKGDVNCTALWDAFSSAAQMSNLVVTANDYAPFMGLANFASPPNQALLWCGNQNNALLLASSSNTQYTVVETTPTGGILSNLFWCGLSNNSFDYTDQCTYGSNATYFGMQGAWNLFALAFGQGISGHVTIFLQPSQINNNGSYLAYRNTSLAGVSLASINTSKVTSVSILLLTNLTAAPYETCTNGTTQNLTQTITSTFGIKPKCTDDFETIYKQLCPNGKTTNTPQCLAALLALGDSTTMPKTEGLLLSWALTMTVLVAALTVLTVYYGLRTRVLESELRI